MMNYEETQIWQRIQSFHPDKSEAAFKFSQRLARENKWSEFYALTVIEEYKKFLFLCATDSRGVTPSDAVDQAWHLHLTYTSSYWGDLCRDTIGKELHHNPTLGGQEERDKFFDYYRHTLQLYQEKFGESPPEDIWPPPEKRFKQTDFIRISPTDYFLFKKPDRDYTFKYLFLCAIITIFGFAAHVPKFILPACGILGFLLLVVFKANVQITGGSGWSDGGGCSSDGDHGCSGDSGCSSGCSGCGGGCSGCGGGCS